MTDEYEWGPWIEHDGSGRPNLDGVPRQIEYADGQIIDTTAYSQVFFDIRPYTGPKFADSWDWSKPGFFIPVIRYRIRKPRALRELRELVEKLPAPERETT